MEEHPPTPASIELVLEGDWAPLKAIDKEFGEQAVSMDFPSIDRPDLAITMTHDPDPEQENYNVFTFTRPGSTDSFFVVIIDKENNIARAAIIKEELEVKGDVEAFSDSINEQALSGHTIPTVEELGELDEIVKAYINSQVAEHALRIKNI